MCVCECACVLHCLPGNPLLKAVFFSPCTCASVVVKACCHGDKQLKNPLLTDRPPAGGGK